MEFGSEETLPHRAVQGQGRFKRCDNRQGQLQLFSYCLLIHYIKVNENARVVTAV